MVEIIWSLWVGFILAWCTHVIAFAVDAFSGLLGVVKVFKQIQCSIYEHTVNVKQKDSDKSCVFMIAQKRRENGGGGMNK